MLSHSTSSDPLVISSLDLNIMPPVTSILFQPPFHVHDKCVILPGVEEAATAEAYNRTLAGRHAAVTGAAGQQGKC